MRLVVRPQAQGELLAGRDWYEERRPGLGADFSAAVDRAVERIEERPSSFPYVHEQIRRAVLRRFPYAVFFQVLQDEIVILGVVHNRRHPRSWQSRR